MNPAIHHLIDQAEGSSPTESAFHSLIGAVRHLACEVGSLEDRVNAWDKARMMQAVDDAQRVVDDRQAIRAKAPKGFPIGQAVPMGQAIPPAVAPMMSPRELAEAEGAKIIDAGQPTRARWRVVMDLLACSPSQAEDVCIKHGVVPCTAIYFSRTR